MIEGASVLVLAEDAALRRALAREIVERRAEALTAADLETATSLLLTRSVDVVVLDASLPEGAPRLIERLRKIDGQLEVVLALKEERATDVLRSLGSIDRQHRLDVVILPVPTALCWNISIARAIQRRRLESTIAVLEQQHAHLGVTEEMLGASVAMRELHKRIGMIASAISPVLIEGERGTGKELLARQIHERGIRSASPFVTLSCSAIAEAHQIDELFGTATHQGAIERASRGTLFLEEIEALSHESQRRLLGWLADPTSSGVRSGAEPRLIASTRVDLRRRVKTGELRDDLFYRLNVIPLRVPSLRQRKDDIPLLAHHFLKRHAARQKKEVLRVGVEAMRLLRAHPWPGNVRQLDSCIERAVVMARTDTIVPGDLQLEDETATPSEIRIVAATTKGPSAHAVVEEPVATMPAPELDASAWLQLPYAQAKEAALQAFHNKYVDALVSRVGANISEAARHAGLDRSNFRRILKAAGLATRFGTNPTQRDKGQESNTTGEIELEHDNDDAR